MSGHSKWSNIKHKKEKSDAQKARIFTRIGREIAVAVREGGPDPEANSKLKDAIAKAKANNIPNDNITRSIKKAAGETGGAIYEEILYEGYGPSGIAVLAEAVTDNKNRTAGDMRHYFDKFGGNLGTANSVSWMFDKKGVIIIENNDKIDEDTLIMEALEGGADDVTTQPEYFEILTMPENFHSVRDFLEGKGYSFSSCEVEMIPQNTIKLTNEDDIIKMNRLLALIEDNDDIQNVYHNWEAPEEMEDE